MLLLKMYTIKDTNEITKNGNFWIFPNIYNTKRKAKTKKNANKIYKYNVHVSFN